MFRDPSCIGAAEFTCNARLRQVAGRVGGLGRLGRPFSSYAIGGAGTPETAGIQSYKNAPHTEIGIAKGRPTRPKPSNTCATDTVGTRRPADGACSGGVRRSPASRSRCSGHSTSGHRPGNRLSDHQRRHLPVSIRSVTEAMPAPSGLCKTLKMSSLAARSVEIGIRIPNLDWHYHVTSLTCESQMPQFPLILRHHACRCVTVRQGA